MGSDEFPEALNFRFASLNSSGHRGELALDNYGDVSSAKLFFAHDFDAGGFAGGVNGFKDSSEALSLNKAQGHGRFLVHRSGSSLRRVDGTLKRMNRVSVENDGLLNEWTELVLGP